MSDDRLLGFHAIRARLRSAPETIKTVWMDANRKDGRIKALRVELDAARISVQMCSADKLDGLSQGERHQGVVAVAEVRQGFDDLEQLLEALQSSEATHAGLLLALDGVTDPHNLGAILRTADATGVQGVIAPKDRSAPLNEVATRVSAGGAEQVPYLRVTNLSRALESLQQAGYWVIGLDEAGEASLFEADLRGPTVLVLGAEGAGLRRMTREHCDSLAALPMLGSVESLNVSASCAVACYEVIRQRRFSR